MAIFTTALETQVECTVVCLIHATSVSTETLVLHTVCMEVYDKDKDAYDKFIPNSTITQ